MVIFFFTKQDSANELRFERTFPGTDRLIIKGIEIKIVGVQREVLIAETDSEMDVNIHDEGQTGIKEVTGYVPTEEKIYAVSMPI